MRYKVRRLFKEQLGNCYLCGFPMEGDVTIDEVHPKWHGGKTFLENQKLAHYQCNSDKSAMSYDEFIFLLDRGYVRKSLWLLIFKLSLIR